MTGLSGYQQTTADWRAQIQRNQTKTRAVIATFILLYLLVGLLVDVVIYLNFYHATATQLLFALLSLQLTPYATIIMAGIAGLSLLATYAMYNKIMLFGTQYLEVKPDQFNDLQEKQLYHVIEEMKVAASMNYMPRIFIIEADYMNAFASGYSEKSAMVAITRGLLNKLNRRELQAVMAHELSHIRHLDIKLTLTVAVLSNIMLMVIDLLFYTVVFSRNRRQGTHPIILVIMVLRFVLPTLTVLLSLFLSRTREYMADAGCVQLMRDNEPLASALLKIHQDHKDNAQTYRADYSNTPNEDVRRASYIFDPVKTGIEPAMSLTGAFSTHPKMKDRLSALGFVEK